MKLQLAAGASLLLALGAARPTVDTAYPYTGPAVPIGDWVNPTINGNGKGYPRLVEPPAVKPASAHPTNNVNVISLSYLPDGMHIHYQTPFGLGERPSVRWGSSPGNLSSLATGWTHTYDRTPSCSQIRAVTQCSQFFHEVSLPNLESATTYYYQIPAANGTTESQVLRFTTARAPGDKTPFSIAVLNDMGYTNAQGTHRQLLAAADKGAAFAWHGGDLSYADDWYSGILPCADDWPVCYNGTSTALPGGGPIPDEYLRPLPAGESPNQGGPNGGDMSVLYESNWDLWQQWMANLTTRIPHMVMPGNHESACAEFDGPGNPMTAYLNNGIPNGTAPATNLTYYSCPPSQRNFTAFQHRFRMPGAETGGVGNFWYSFDYGLAHFVSLDGETDFASSPFSTLARDRTGNETRARPEETETTDSGPFGAIDGDREDDNEAYAQVQWLARDLAAVDRARTPWVFVMSHRPMYSSAYSSYQTNVRKAFEELLLRYGVDAYLSGHIHWYERMYPMTLNGTVDESAVVSNHTYLANTGVSMTHIVNGMAGNIESHSEFDEGEGLTEITAKLDRTHYGFSKLTVVNETVVTWEFVKGEDGSTGDYLTLVKGSTCTIDV
ncbi:purple acid phosphatase family protein [Aspergillus mulundensis]|uniref:Purple acid phosphatase n=1 Tax=Aspergillus mulundensis TaxID=1810919 RepID=A0A3D8QHC4_9EURO|nr:Purple acid phosphatase [Aspergillus mulundensis]RDW61121.1 Purple acid phosphatase [Aspergillus mulundensis]